jgi:hypothetical protein
MKKIRADNKNVLTRRQARQMSGRSEGVEILYDVNWKYDVLG